MSMISGLVGGLETRASSHKRCYHVLGSGFEPMLAMFVDPKVEMKVEVKVEPAKFFA